jgi:hypothetical protein
MVNFLKGLIFLVLMVGFIVGISTLLPSSPGAAAVAGIGCFLIMYFMYREEADADMGWDRNGNPFKDL